MGTGVSDRGERNAMTMDKAKGLRLYLRETPIIPAIRKVEHLELALRSHSTVIYFLTGDPEICESLMQATLAAGKLPIVNLDLFNGFSRDKYAVNYLKRCGAQGIISTHLDPLRHARSIGLYAIQRTFLLDSGAMDTITAQLRHTLVDALEVLPAPVAPKLLDRVHAIAPEMPVVGGGLIRTMKEVEQLILEGVDGVSISNHELWL